MEITYVEIDESHKTRKCGARKQCTERSLRAGLKGNERGGPIKAVSRSIVRVYAIDAVMNRGGKVRVVVKDAAPFPGPYFNLIALALSSVARYFRRAFLIGSCEHETRASSPHVAPSAHFHLCHDGECQSESVPPQLKA